MLLDIEYLKARELGLPTNGGFSGETPRRLRYEEAAAYKADRPDPRSRSATRRTAAARSGSGIPDGTGVAQTGVGCDHPTTAVDEACHHAIPVS